MRDLREFDWGRVADIAIFTALLASGFGQLTWGDTNGPIWANAILMTAIALPALWRRSDPELAFAASMTAVLVVALAYYPSGTDGPGESWFGFLIMTFSLALYGEGRARTFATLYGAAAFAAINTGQLIVGTDPFDVFTAWVFPVVAWLGGWALHQRQAAAERHRGRADEAELRRAEDARRAVELERARIARELHDAVAHAMSVMVVQAEAAEAMLDVDAERARRPIRRVQHVGREGLAEMRRLLGVLRQGESPARAPQPGLDSVPSLVDAVREAGLAVNLRIEGTPRQLPAGVDISAYRIVQEALTNTLTHARAHHVDLRVEYGDELTIDIEDDGVGSTSNGRGGGHGLLGMRERVDVYGGVLEAGPAESGGFRVRATLPVDGRT